MVLPAISVDVLPSVDPAAQPCEAASDFAASFAGLLMVMQQPPQVTPPAWPADLAAPVLPVGALLKTPVTAATPVMGVAASLPTDAPEGELVPLDTQSSPMQDPSAEASPAALPSVDAAPPTLAGSLQQIGPDAPAAGLKPPVQYAALPASARPAASNVASVQATPPNAEAELVAALNTASVTVTKARATTAPPSATVVREEAATLAPEGVQPQALLMAPAPQKATVQPAAAGVSVVAGAMATTAGGIAAAKSSAATKEDATVAMAPQLPPRNSQAAATAVPLTTAAVAAVPITPTVVPPPSPKAPLPAVAAATPAVVAALADIAVTPVPPANKSGENTEKADEPAELPMPEQAPLSASLPASPSTIPNSTSAAASTEVASASAVREAGATQPDTEAGTVTHLRVELAPPLLGEVVLELRHERDEIAATVIVERPASVETLKLVQAQVQQVLGDQGIHVGSFEVSCRDGRQGQERAAPAEAPVPERSHPQASPQPRKAVATRASTTLVDLYA